MGFGHWGILLVILGTLVVLAGVIVAIIVVSNVLTHRLLDRRKN